MHHQKLFAILSFAPAVFASVLNLNIYTDSDGNPAESSHQSVLSQSKKVRPQWEKRDDLHLIPLVPEARTGVLPAAVEEGLIFTVGPRFVNKFIENELEIMQNSSANVASCFPGCVETVIKAVPCILAAAACECLTPILSCPVSEGDICSCVSCFPEVIENAIHKLGFCSSNTKTLTYDRARKHAHTRKDGEALYANYGAYSRRDVALQGLRGDLSETVIEDAKELVADGFCPTGPCGGCSCCLGVCVFGNCGGVCLPLPSLESHGHEDL